MVQKGVAQWVHIKGCGQGVSVRVGVVVWLKRRALFTLVVAQIFDRWRAHYQTCLKGVKREVCMEETHKAELLMYVE
jgi:hypothetical protein